MIIVPLSAIPNQNITIKLDGNTYGITINSINNTEDPENNLMAATVERNNEELISGFKLVSGAPVIPYRYLEDGNFVFTTEFEEYPNYLRFGIDQFLFYASQEELEEFRAAA